MATADFQRALERGFRDHERLLWGLSYRMTGSGADADEIVQQTFVRALERPPSDLTTPLRPWLVRIATNLSVDALRRRKRESYVGPWLPEPLPTPSGPPDDVPGAKYERLESVTYAFLRALEALSPKARAVLLLRDVLDYSVRETARALELSEGNVKVLHHRARKAMAAYDEERRIPGEVERERTRKALEAFIGALMAGDAEAMRAMLTEDVVALNDGAGEFLAARKPLVGRDRVVLFHQRIRRLYPDDAEGNRFEVELLNGLPGLRVELGRPIPGAAPRQLILIDTAPTGRIRRIHAVLASAKVDRAFRPAVGA